MDGAVRETKKLCKKVKELSKSAAKFIRWVVTFARDEKEKLIPWNNNRKANGRAI